jgi:uncharacterized protein YceK
MWLRSVLWICLCLSGCGVVSEQSIYEGMRSTERAKSAGTEQQDKALPNYDAYSKERELLKK